MDPTLSRLDDGRILWLTGDPGCGKSYLAAHTVEWLRGHGCDTSFYFFEHGNKRKRTVEDLLRHITYQRASKSAELRHSLLTLSSEEPRLLVDIGTLWNRFFHQRVFQTDPERLQYWVIDALDECENFHELLLRLDSLPPKYRVFFTSRNEDGLSEILDQSGSIVMKAQIPKIETLKDIRKYLESNKDKLHADTKSEIQDRISKLESKSKGSFLWVHLTVKELRSLYKKSNIEDALRNVPDGMGSLYARILADMAQQRHKADARTLLQWAITSARPMKVAELAAAFSWDMQERLISPVDAIKTYCGSLLEVDDDRQIVDVAHHTVREYLFQRKTSSTEAVPQYFAFDKNLCHGRLSVVCVKYLNERLSPQSFMAGREEPFFSYASEHFSEHVKNASGMREKQEVERLISALTDFFKRPVLSWIHHLVEKSRQRGLTTIMEAGVKLRTFVDQRLNLDLVSLEQADRALQELRHWADDLIHIVTVFGKDLVKKPEAIQNAIPALCPSRSMMNRKLGNLGVGLRVIGNPEETWPDLISSNSFDPHILTALASSERFYAANLQLPREGQAPEKNEIVIFSSETCQETGRIVAHEKINRLGFAHRRNWIIAAGWTTISLYTYDKKEEVWSKQPDRPSLAVAFTRDDSHIITVTREKVVETRKTESGEIESQRQIERSEDSGNHAQQACKCLFLVYNDRIY